MNTAKIQQLGRECRELADQGKKLNKGEATLFSNSLYMNDLQMCERLIKTLRERKPE